MFDLRKILDLRKIFAVPKDFLKSKIYCSSLTTRLSLFLAFWIFVLFSGSHMEKNRWVLINVLMLIFNIYVLI